VSISFGCTHCITPSHGNNSSKLSGHIANTSLIYTPSIIRILFMVPVYSTATVLSDLYYWQSAYFQPINATYAAIAVASYFSLLCHYMGRHMHEYKIFFRAISPRPWGNFFPMPIGWFRAFCGGEGGIWRTPRSGLTWFNVCSSFRYYLLS